MGTADFTKVDLSNYKAPDWATYTQTDGMDLIWHQTYLQVQMEKIEDQILATEDDANLSDTEKMLSMQMLQNSWHVIMNLRTNVIKNIFESLRACVRNIN